MEIIASIDTLAISTPDTLRKSEQNADVSDLPEGVKDIGRDTPKDIGRNLTSYKINPNTNAGQEIYTFSGFQEQMRTILEDMKISRFWYSRVDFRFDSYQPSGSYENMEKLNRALIMCYFFKHPISRNLYETRHGWNRKRLSFCYRTNTVQLEFYNKPEEERTSMILSRLELRSVSLARTKDNFLIDRPVKLAQRWKEKLVECIGVYQQMQHEQNAVLFQQYQAGMQSGIYNNATDFIQKNIEYIFTGEQMEELFWMMGAANPKTARYNFVSRHKKLTINFIKDKELRAYILYLISCLDEFFSK